MAVTFSRAAEQLDLGQPSQCIENTDSLVEVSRHAHRITLKTFHAGPDRPKASARS